jgi:hypothetical protein
VLDASPALEYHPAACACAHGVYLSEVLMLRGCGRCILFWLASLTILPGCQRFAYLPGDQTGPTYTYLPCESDKQVFSTTQATDNPKSTQAKSIARPASMVNPLALEPVGPSVPPRSLGPMVTVQNPADIESDIEPAGVKKADVPPPQYLPKVSEPKTDKDDYAPVVSALDCMLRNRHEEALKHLRAYDDDTQEFLLRFLPPLTQFLKKPIAEMTPQEMDNLIAQLRGLEHSVRARSELVVAKMCYCKSIMNFGQYEPLPDSHAFLTATDNRPGERVQVYVELKNFVSEKTNNGDYITRLAVALELINAKGEKVWSHAFDKKDTQAPRRTRLNDFYSGYSFYVPALPAGTYQLTIQIADETIPGQRRVARKSLDFRVTPVATHTTLR